MHVLGKGNRAPLLVERYVTQIRLIGALEGGIPSIARNITGIEEGYIIVQVNDIDADSLICATNHACKVVLHSHREGVGWGRLEVETRITNDVDLAILPVNDEMVIRRNVINQTRQALFLCKEVNVRGIDGTNDAGDAFLNEKLTIPSRCEEGVMFVLINDSDATRHRIRLRASIRGRDCHTERRLLFIVNGSIQCRNRAIFIHGEYCSTRLIQSVCDHIIATTHVKAPISIRG